MTTTSSNQFPGSYFRQDGFPVSGILAGETSQLAKIGDEFPKEPSNDEETSSSEQEFDSEEVSEGGGVDIQNKLQPSDSNPNPSPLKVRPHRRKLFSRREKAIKTALDEFKSRLENTLQENSFLNYAHKDENPKRVVQNLKDITLWGVPLLPSKGHEETNMILLKFLKAQDYRVPEALEMLRQTLIWREKQGIDHILEEKLEEEIESELNKVVFIDSVDKDGHPLCFSLYGPFKDKKLYNKVFGTEKNREEFLRWRIQFMEKSIKRLNFKEGGVNSFVFISDMKNAPGPGSRMKELSLLSKDAVSVFQRHYPDLVFKHIIINTPFWYYVYHSMILQYCTHGTRKTFVFARRHRVTQTLLKYIPPQNIPVQYGGLRRVNDEEFTTEDEPQEFSLRAHGISTFQIPISEGKVTNTIVWEVMVVGWDVTYKDEFIPYDEGSYKILLLKKKMNGENVRNSFYINEPGKILITIKNATYIKKRAFIRHKAKLTLPMYMSCTQGQTS